MTDSAGVLHKLMDVVRERRDAPSPDSYTCRLFAGGIGKIGGKVTEEAAEVVEAAGEPGESGRSHLIREAADLLYHVLVLLAARDADLRDVEEELARRFGISGLKEKAARRNE
jgi:phosphoribosyl-ATP pyrophosphohydrolase